MMACCWLLLTYLTPIFGALPPDGGTRRPISDTLPAHYEGPPYMPWVPAGGTVAAVRCTTPSHVIRDGHVSIQVNVDRYGCNIPRDAANEPSIAIDPTDPRKIVIGWRQFDSIESNFRQAGAGYSHDAGHTWVSHGPIEPGLFGSDPVLAAAPDGTFYYLSAVFTEPFTSALFRSENGGASWNEPLPAFGGDKPWMEVDRTNSAGRGNIYVTSSSGFFRSFNGGASFDETYSFRPGWPTLSLDSSGRVYVSTSTSSSIPAVFLLSNALDPAQETTYDYFTRLDFNGGVYFGGLPNPAGLLGQLWVATGQLQQTETENVYLLGSLGSNNAPTQVYFWRSSDQARTLSPTFRVNDDPADNGAWHWFAMMSVAPNGRIDAVWNDTRNYTDAPEANLCELYYAKSTDAGDTWSPNIPVSPVFDSHVGWPQQNKLGDYYHMLSDNLGVNVAYAATFNGEQDIYFLRIGPWDCNGNEVPDEDDIAAATSLDCNANEVPDECEYRGDFDGDRLTTLRDLAAFQNCFTGSTLEMMVREGIHAPASAPGMNPDATTAPPTRGGATSGTRPTKPITARNETLPDPCCGLFDLEPDGDVDSTDLAAIQRVLTGP